MTTRYLLGLGLFLMAFPILASAHPGNTDAYGCHTCRTNCPNWGLSYGEYHCHNAKSSSQPESPIRSHYGEGGTGYTEPWPDYEYGSNYSPTPSCPIHSTYNSLSDSCKCNYGYVVQGSSCVDGDSVCRSEFGYNSSYDTSSQTCECDYGYALNSSGQCVSRDTYCRDKFGYNAEYDILTGSCACKNGYVNNGDNQCISADTFCRNEIGLFSRYDSLRDECACTHGYELVGSRCVEADVEISDLDIEPIFKPSYSGPAVPVITPSLIGKKSEAEKPTHTTEAATLTNNTTESVPEAHDAPLIGSTTSSTTPVTIDPMLYDWDKYHESFLSKIFKRIRGWFW